MSLLHTELTDLVKLLLRGSADRDRVFAYFTAALKLNAKRAHDVRFPQPGVSSDGFMLNLSAVLLKVGFC